MKKRLKSMCSIFPFIILLVVLLLNQIYKNKQELIILEGNQLRTAKHIPISTDELAEAVTVVEASEEVNWLIEHASISNQLVLNVFSKDLDKLNLPITTDVPLTSGRQAFVGRSVETTSAGNKDYVTIAGVDYEVVGQLGLLKSSPLDDYVLISDKELLGLGDEISLNGKVPEGATQFKRRGTSMGVERLMSLSYFGGLIDVVSYVIVVLSALIWSYFMVLRHQTVYRIYHLIGLRYKVIYQTEMLKFMTGCVIASLMVWSLSPEKPIRSHLLEQYFLLCLIVAIGFSYFFYKGVRDDYGR